MSNVVLGIDIGVAGAVALLGADGSLLAVDDMPVLRDGPKNRASICRLLACGMARLLGFTIPPHEDMEGKRWTLGRLKGKE
jgi:hypothetical protein